MRSFRQFIYTNKHISCVSAETHTCGGLPLARTPWASMNHAQIVFICEVHVNSGATRPQGKNRCPSKLSWLPRVIHLETKWRRCLSWKSPHNCNERLSDPSQTRESVNFFICDWRNVTAIRARSFRVLGQLQALRSKHHSLAFEQQTHVSNTNKCL